MLLSYSYRTKSRVFFRQLVTSHNALLSIFSLCVSCRVMVVGFVNVPHLFYSKHIRHCMSAHFIVIDRLFLLFYTKNMNDGQFGWDYSYQLLIKKMCRYQATLYCWLLRFTNDFINNRFQCKLLQVLSFHFLNTQQKNIHFAWCKSAINFVSISVRKLKETTNKLKLEEHICFGRIIAFY